MTPTAEARALLCPTFPSTERGATCPSVAAAAPRVAVGRPVRQDRGEPVVRAAPAHPREQAAPAQRAGAVADPTG